MTKRDRKKGQIQAYRALEQNRKPPVEGFGNKHDGENRIMVRKKDNLLLGDRTPAYLGRETGAAELEISPSTWDRWVKEGILPAPCDAFPNGSPRWRWGDVDRKLSGEIPTTSDKDAAMIRGALNFGSLTRKRRRRRFSE